MKSRSFSVLPFALLLIQGAIAQQHSFEKPLLSIDSSLQQYDEAYPRENIFLVTDKKEYVAGETVWLNSFISVHQQPTFLSKTVYIELANYDGKVIEKKMLPVVNGTSAVNIKIPDTVSSGAYIINAYTLWMKNMPATIAQTQVFVIGDDYAAKPFRLQKQESVCAKVIIQPEGGVWGEGIENNFLVRLTGKNNLPVKDTFYITDNTNKPIAAGRTNEYGLAKITFTPAAGNRTYKFNATGMTSNITLEASKGISIKTDATNKSKLFISLDKSSDNKKNNFLVMGIHQNKICYQSVFDFNEGATATAVNRNKLPAGVITFWVLDEENTVLAHRKIYNTPAAIAGPEVTIQNTEGKKRITIPSTLNAGFITAVATRPLLTGDGGTVINLLPSIPELQQDYFVELDNLQTDQSLAVIDQLLLSQTTGLLGAKWQVQPPALKYIVESGITIRGKVAPFVGKIDAQGYDAELIIKGDDSSTTLSKAKTFPNGDFTVPDVQFKKEARIYFQAHNPKNKKELMKMELYPSFFDTLKTAALAPLIRYPKEYLKGQLDPAFKKLLDSLKPVDPRFRELQQVVVTAKAKSRMDSLKQEYLSPIFNDGTSQVLVPERTNYISIWQFIRGSVPGIIIEGDLLDPVVRFSRYNEAPQSTGTGEDMSDAMENPTGIYFFLNEVQVSKDVLNSIQVEDIALVTVNKQPTATLGAYNGYIAVFTKKGAATSTTDKSLASDKRKGYSVTREVYLYLSEEKEPQPGNTLAWRSFSKPLPKPIVFNVPGSLNSELIIGGWDANGKLVIERKTIQ
ncbi:hypothetical protein HB364_28490 [Pseudoflavitalea sp. X16]|uniref:hypothetical protein n=1 Tax=Paraflavitalea devenefica TaxID=2716334 RepID=UPI0014222BB4|nr:hypothetical protein [Paraflavitalea devenefica]NII29051.1 hypothetical protein [Paraflavitalea devenefica]